MTRKTPGPCTYCKRQMTAPTDRANTSLTVDHVMPQCVGGTRKVWCCRLCNNLKGDLHPSAWRWFTEHYPGWWRTFRTNHEVMIVCREKLGAGIRASMIGPMRRDEFEESRNAGPR